MLKDYMSVLLEAKEKTFIASEDIATKGVVSSAGSRMLENFVPPYDASVVKKLKDAGYSLLGKAKMSPFSFTELADAKGEPCVLGRLGAHAAAKALMESDARFALASDTFGQLRISAARAGAIGFKPSYGYVSRLGLISVAASLEAIGVIARDIETMREALELIVFKDESDVTSVKGDLAAPSNKPRIGVVPGFDDDGVKKAADAYKALGYEVTELGVPDVALANGICGIIACVEFASSAARYDGVKFGFRAAADELGDMYELTRAQGFDYHTKRSILLGTMFTREKYYEDYAVKAMRLRRMLKQSVSALFGSCDVWLLPGVGCEDEYEYTRLASLCGFPAIVLPLGGRPLCEAPAIGAQQGENISGGVQLIGAHGSDSLLLSASEALLGGI